MELNVLDVLEAKNLNEFRNLLGMFTDVRSISAIKYCRFKRNLQVRKSPSPWHFKGYPEIHHRRLTLFLCCLPHQKGCWAKLDLFLLYCVESCSYKCCKGFISNWFLSTLFYLFSFTSKLFCLNNKQINRL